ncbi:MAG: glycosyltransferase family 4 protein [Rubrobacteraceae bacterium]
MRILLTVHQFLPKHTYGTERLTFDTGQELMARGHEVYVLTTDSIPAEEPHNVAQDYEYEGLKVRCIQTDLRRTPDPTRYEYDNPQMAEHMRAYMREVEPDLVHVMHAGRLSGSVIPAAREFGVPVVFTATDFWSLCRVIHLRRADTGALCLGPNSSGTNCLRCFIARTGAPQKAKDRYLKRSEVQFRAASALSQTSTMRNTKYMNRIRTVVDRIDYLKDVVNSTDRVIAPTRLNRDIMIRNGIDPALIHLSPYGMDTSDISSVPPSPTHPSVPRIGYIGSLASHKGTDILIKAVRSIPEAAKIELKVYGSPSRDPHYFKQLEGLAEGDGRISFTGTFDPDETGRILSEIDVLVVPSRWYENTPLVVYSAFASGTPVVATNLGGLSEVVEHDVNGLLFEAEDIQGLSSNLLRFLFEEDLIERLRKGIKPVKTVEDSVDELEELYEELTERRVSNAGKKY